MERMKYWGVKVKRGERLNVTVGRRSTIRFSLACLGKYEGKESVRLFLKLGDEKKRSVLAILSPEKRPQMSFDLMFDKTFQLSHDWERGGVYFRGYEIIRDFDSDSESDDEESNKEDEGFDKQDEEVDGEEFENLEESDENQKKQFNSNVAYVDPNISQIFGESESFSLAEHVGYANAITENPADQNDDESQVMKGKKRSAEKETSVSDKKPKLGTLQNSGEIGVLNTLNSNLNKKQNERRFSCVLCNRLFSTQGGLNSHSKDKHGVVG